MKIKIKTIRLAENCLILLLLLFLLISCKKENTELLKNRSTEESKQDIQKQNDPVSDQLTITEVENFILKWCSYQTNYNIQAYLNCYSPEFLGVKKQIQANNTYTIIQTGQKTELKCIRQHRI
ncbi:MAG: hypothetical protein IPL16_18335 [Ignavibacteria bacterium]|nr:hypothetical protein [Ignavibacteria bacterium]